MKFKLLFIMSTMVALSLAAMEKQERPEKRKEIPQDIIENASEEKSAKFMREEETDAELMKIEELQQSAELKLENLHKDMLSYICTFLFAIGVHGDNKQDLTTTLQRIRTFMRLNSSFSVLYTDIDCTDLLIKELAKRYCTGNLALAAMALNTPGARAWILKNLLKPQDNPELKENAQKKQVHKELYTYLGGFLDGRMRMYNTLLTFLVHNLSVIDLQRLCPADMPIRSERLLNYMIRQHDIDAIKKLIYCGIFHNVTDLTLVLNQVIDSGNHAILEHLLAVRKKNQRVDTQLFINAASKPSIKVMQALIQHELMQRPNCMSPVIDPYGEVLKVALRAHNNEMVKFLIENGSVINAINPQQSMLLNQYVNFNHPRFTPLAIAAELGNLEIVNFLLDKGADVHLYIKAEDNALIRAIKGGHVDIVKRLLQTDILINDREVQIALNALQYPGKIQIIQQLIADAKSARGINNPSMYPGDVMASISSPSFGFPSFEPIVRRGRNRRASSRMVTAGALSGVIPPAPMLTTPTVPMPSTGMLTAGASIRLMSPAPMPTRSTAPMPMISTGPIPMSPIMANRAPVVPLPNTVLPSSAMPSIPLPTRSQIVTKPAPLPMPFITPAQIAKPAATNTLAQNMANIQAQAQTAMARLAAQTAMQPAQSHAVASRSVEDQLWRAIIGNDIATVTNLLAQPLNIDASNHGTTFLMYAARVGHLEIVQALLNAGADTRLKNNKGQNALDYAKSSKSPNKDEVIKLLSPK